MLHFFACDRQTRKKKTKYMSFLPFYGDFLRPLHFKLESGCASFCYVLKTCRFVWVSSLGRPNIGGVWHGKFTNFVKTFVKLFFSHIFFDKIGWNWWTAVFAWIFLVKIRTQTWWKMLSTWEMHLFWAICLTRTLASIQRVQWIVGSCATLHFLMRRTWTCMNPHTKVPRGPGEQGFPHGWFFVEFFFVDLSL